MMEPPHLSEGDIAKVRICWEQVTGHRLTETEQQQFARKLADYPELAEHRREDLRAFAFSALQGSGGQKKLLPLEDWLASIQTSRRKKQTPWSHDRCVRSYVARAAYKRKAEYEGTCGKCGAEINVGDMITHSY